MTDEIKLHMARAFFASAWADAIEENGGTLRGEIMSQMPDDLDPAAIRAADTLAMDMERENGATLAQLLERVEAMADGDREPSAEMFGHYCAMQAMGHGVGLHDAFGHDAAETVRVPYIEFSWLELDRDY